MNRLLRSILLTLSLFLTQAFMAQKLYWVGGSGNFNDPNHWSQQSGGVGGAKTPTATDDVYFDENSFLDKSIINFIGASQVHDFIFTKYTPIITFSGLQNEKITINGNVQLNSYIDNQFAGDVWLTSNQASTSVVFDLVKFKGNIYFNGNTNWQLQGDIATADNAGVYFKQGVFNLNYAAIYSGNLMADPQVTINSNQASYRITNNFVLPAGVTFNDTKSDIYAYTKDATKFQVASNIVFNANSRLHSINSVMTACNITLVSFTQPTCSGSCDGTIVFHIPKATCSSFDSIVCVWNNLPGCTVIPNAYFTVGSTPTTYSITGLCGSINQYGFSFGNNANEDSVYFSSGISMANPVPPQVKSITAVPTKCFGSCDGMVIINVKNQGTFNQTSHWTSSTFTNTVNHSGITNNPNYKDTLKLACAGTYTVTLTDANNCPSATSTTITVTQPALVTHTITPTNILCFGVCNGSANELMAGGTSPFTFTWTAVGGTVGSTATSSTYSALCAGTYTVRTKDAHGCKDSATVVITQPPNITFTKNPASGLLNIPCLNACNGSVGVNSVSGGTGAYTFSWSPAGGTPINGANSSVYTGLCGSVAGLTYTCTITDSNNCVKTTNFTVKAPPALSHTITGTNPKCNAGATGSATVTESGGVPAYTFTWSPAGTVTGPSPKSVNSNLAGGTYTVVATDANGCTDTAKVTLTPPPVLTASITAIVNPTCPNLNNGELCVTPGGGTPTYTFTWNPASAGTASCTPATLVSGTYTVTIKDANSCTVTTSATLVPPPSITVTAMVTQPSCAGLSNGSATLTATGGNGVFSYHWSCSASVTNSISGQAGGTTCNYTVTDGNNCKQTGSVSFVSPSPLTLTLTPTTLACNGNCNAQITTGIGGGTPTFSYAWLGTGANPVCSTCSNQTNMCAGSYTCTVTDFNGCAKTATTSIAAPTPITVTFTPVNPICAGSCNGSINAAISGGTGTYPGISWSPALPAPNAPNTLHPINLCAGTYSLQVTDGNFCTVTDTVSLIDPSPVTISLSTTSITCAGQNNGTATVTPSGGSGSYQYSWDNGAFGPSASESNLSSGSHTVIVKDSKGCLSAAQVFIINQPTNLTANVINIVNTCNGLCNGSATASPAGGTPGYQYGWDASPFSSGAISINALCVGTHTLFVKDSNNCITSATFSITPIINISISSSSTSVSCHNLCDATATGSASGGASPYTIQWTGPSSSNTCNNVPSGSPCIGINLCGTSTITATDANGCSNTATVSIANPPALTAVTNTTSVECFGLCTGTATVTPSGGTPAASAPFYAIAWSPGPLPNGTTESNLCPGTYTATITDNNGCQLAQPVIIGVSNQFTVNPTITPPSTCGASDASIKLAISGGSGTYTVNWNTGSTANPLTNLAAGTYTATINDANGCDTVIVYGINNLTGPTTTVTINNNVTCPGQNNGSATVSGSGSAPITVIWPAPNPTGPSPQTGTNLGGGTTLVQVKDVTGCITTATVTIIAPSAIDDGETVIQPTCGGTLGSIILNPSGGNGAPYSYSWNGGPFVVGNNTLTNLSPGVDSCVIQDALGCISQTFTYAINSASTLSLTVNTTSVTCSYSKNGTATATASGSFHPPYTYTWTNSSNIVIAQGTNISNVSALAPGTYSLSVNDASGCNIQTTFTISAPLAINPNFVKNNNLCSFGSTGGATVTPTGGTAGYTYLWNTSNPNPTTPSVDSIIPGSYHVIVYDANLCSDTTFFTITLPSAVSMTVASTNPTCFGLANGSATITAVSGGTPFTTNGTPPYTLSWGGVGCPTCSVVTNLSGTTYTAIAVDSNGCSVSQNITLISPLQILPGISDTPPSCVGSSNGSITANPSQGVGSYSYQWIPHVAGNVPTANNLPAGTYTLIITDGNNCTDTTTTVLSDPPGLSLIYSSTPATCNQSNGSIIISSANGTGTVSVQWVNPPTCLSSYTCSTLPAGIYSIKLTDSNGCTDTLLATVTNTGGPAITTAINDVTCNGTCNGVVSLTVTSGASPYTFTWNSPPTPGSVVNTATTSIASGLCDSTYISIVTDHVGCKTITSFSISQPPQIQDNPNISSATCLGINNGSITSNASGGTPFASGYLYSIDFGPNFGPSVSHTFNNLSAGTHTVTVTDSVGCSRNFSYTIPPNSIITSNISGTNVTCSGDCNGTATVLNIVGGTAPITITWNDPASQVGNFATNLCAGSYTATLTDNAGCKAMDTISIIAPSAINPNTVVTNPACGQCNGNITVAPTGGNGPAYTYTWTSPPSNAPSLNNICAGPYQVTIADNLGCTQTFQIPVSSNGAPTLTVTSTNVACNVPCSGSATVTASGGATPYTYSWPNVVPVSTSSVVSGLCSNTITPYFVQVKDSLGCIATQTVMITAPQTFTVNNTNVSPGCNVCNGVITLTVTGASTYTCQWSANAANATTFTVTNLCAGIYTVVVTDIASGCKQTIVIPLNNNSGPTLTITQTNVSCFGMCNGSATVAAAFGSGGYTYTWSPSGVTGTTVSNLCDSTYFVLVTDNSGCIQTSQVNITSPAALIAGLPTVSPIKCNNNCNGSINTVIFGGTPAYTYSWSPSTVSGTGGANLCPGNYSVTVTDANGCSVQEFDTLVNPALLVTTGTLTPASCNNIANGMITTLTSGGTPTYTYQWSGGSNAQTQNLTNVLSGTYTLVATDARACTDTTRYNLPSTITVIANAGRDTALCNNVPLVLTGTVTGTATFNWQDTTGTIIPPANTLTLSVNPSTTTHYILMAYNGACRDSDTVTVSITPAAIANAGANQSIFFGQTATIGGNPSNPIGGTITWMPNINLSDTAASNPIASPSVTTTYTLFVTNALGCISSDTMMVIVLPPFNINNGFTPNGDGKNDTWVIDELYKFPNTEIEVYNRWGEQLFYSKGAYTPWNGTYKGSPVPVGTYYYIIRLNDKNYPDHYAGPLTILR